MQTLATVVRTRISGYEISSGCSWEHRITNRVDDEHLQVRSAINIFRDHWTE